jgi:hypothetical protein
MKRVVIESPFAAHPRYAEVARDVTGVYLRAAMFDAFERAEAPFASHAIYPQVLDDDSPGERAVGIYAGLVWGRLAEETAAYTDLGISRGMSQGISAALRFGRPVTTRRFIEGRCHYCGSSREPWQVYCSVACAGAGTAEGVPSKALVSAVYHFCRARLRGEPEPTALNLALEMLP